jgi:hypothetical protein
MTPAEVADVIETSGQAFVNLLKTLPPGAAEWRPAVGEWCVNEVVGHIIESEKRGFAGRIRIILGADEPKLEDWKSVEVAQARHDCERNPTDLMNEFEPLRRDSVALVRSLKPEHLSRGGIHPRVARITVDELLHEWIHHDGNHLRQAFANVQAYVWPSMGNAQRFSSP